MILRRVIEHVRTQNWTAVGIDFVIVILGVFLGLQVQGWAEEQGRRKLEASYTERLHDEVVDLQAVRERILDTREHWQAGMVSVTPVLFGELVRPITLAECQGIAFSYIVSDPTDDLPSLFELQSSGRLSIIDNQQVSAALRTFLLTRERARDSRSGIATGIKILPSQYPQLIQVVSPTNANVTPVISGAYRCDAEGMRADPAFLNDFDLNQANFTFHVRDNARVSASLAELHRVLDRNLGLTHEAPTP